MIKTVPPYEIAREALKRLAARKLPPTPMNYQECYNEIANLPNVAGFPEAQLRQISLAMVARNPAQQEQLDQLDASIRKHSWQGIQDALVAFAKLAPQTAASAGEPPPAGDTANFANELLGKLAHIIQSMLPALESDDARYSELVVSLLETLNDPNLDINSLRSELDIIRHRLSLAAAEQVEVKQTLLNLLHLVIENISKLVIEDSWLNGQIDAVLNAVKPPISLRRLDDVEQRIREVMRKQAAAKERSVEAQHEIRLMLAAFIERLVTMNESSASFQDKLEEGARQIAQAASLEDIGPLLATMIEATRAMADDTAKTRVQLDALQAKVLATEAEIAKLHLELDHASDSARHDALTNTLNRKGLDEALTREIANMRRKETPLCVAMLDIDNFKNLNDRLGHVTGDAALIHLVKVVRDSIRPSDSLARYGGEEFVILMPDTALDDANKAMIRLQRELTKNFFLAGKEKILITFSAGVAQFASADTGEDAIHRADQAMYLAKRSGKNRVICG
ncbi:MAG: GGDEF domain-containing protein [Thiobacillus sp.]|nr:GGDEF domain-containing protein [Thiobacillus sp.]